MSPPVSWDALMPARRARKHSAAQADQFSFLATRSISRFRPTGSVSEIRTNSALSGLALPIHSSDTYQGSPICIIGEQARVVKGQRVLAAEKSVRRGWS